jgi:arylsulfatase A-like enzyme
MDVVFIVVDALRADAVGCLGRDADTTPNLDRMAEQSLVFKQAFAQSNYTDVCLSSIFSGQCPREHGVLHHGASFTERNLTAIEEQGTVFLPEILSDEGMRTVGLDWMGRWHRWGYDHYGVGKDDDQTQGGPLDELIGTFKDAAGMLPDPLFNRVEDMYYRYGGIPDPRVDCEDLTDMAISQFESSDEDTFMFLHYWDVHPPFLPPKEYMQFPYEGKDESLSSYFTPDRKGRVGGEYPVYAAGIRDTVGECKEAYDGAVHWVDEQIGRLLDALREQGGLEETLFVVTADHGHNFGEHDIFSDNCSLYDTSVHVPLLVRHPDHGGERIEGLVQHTDLFPTILEYLDIDVPSYARGNVLPDTREFVFSEAVEQRMQMVQDERWKYIRPSDLDHLQAQYWYDQGGNAELYGLEADPRENENVLDEHPVEAERLSALLDEELERQNEKQNRSQRSSRTLVDDEIKSIQENLQALGYADSN